MSPEGKKSRGTAGREIPSTCPTGGLMQSVVDGCCEGPGQEKGARTVPERQRENGTRINGRNTVLSFTLLVFPPFFPPDAKRHSEFVSGVEVHDNSNR
jgi:hypothetical protein